ncbi:DNA protecting protein DprA [Paucilactobacillus hokkaidonensis JCM 18461]|uniref:DNA protecting protein DprA n=2 Tax=Paucilactobacillus hokkaidonensis TaxID=1193095 RepID=A0A0A1GXR3_9LACO|nr:DNA protecting protein DprA [Paucilactobacillus hokkaidonensis JCM 18461]
MNINLFLLKLHLCPGIGIVREFKLYYAFTNNLYNTNITELCILANFTAKQSEVVITNWHSRDLNENVKKHWFECHFITIEDAQYPQQLKESYCPPIVLFYRGKLDLLNTTMLGVVGARKNTSYGKQALKNLLPSIVTKPITIVSGLAAGIDGISHEITLQARGQTIGVIGTGIDVTYPKEHQALQSQVAQFGLLLSEFPLTSKPFRSHFPQRNRIIAGLCETLLVVEAKEKSGSLITASLALQENRNVCAVPGRIDALMSVGCNQLILAGAKPILTANDLLEEFLS